MRKNHLAPAALGLALAAVALLPAPPMRTAAAAREVNAAPAR